MKKLLSVFALSCMLLLIIPTAISAEENTYPTVNINDFIEGSTIVLEEDEDSVLTLTLKKVSDSNSPTLTTFGDSGWSGGNIPSGQNYDFVAEKITKTLGMVTKKMRFEYRVSSVGGYSITDAYNPSLYFSLRTVTSYSLDIGVKKATNSAPARVSLNWASNKDIVGVPVGLKTGYLTSQIDSSGRIRITWDY